MKRTAPTRRTPLPPRKARLSRSAKPIRSRRTALPRPSTAIRARKKDPSKRRFAQHRCQPFLDWLKLQPCCVTGAKLLPWVWGLSVVVDPAHIKARGAGGDDLYHALPLAHHLHVEQHTIGDKTFWKKYGLDPVAIAKEHTERFLALYPEHDGGRAPHD